EEYPAAYFVCDLLALEGHDVRPLPLLLRKDLLKEVLPAAGALRYSDHIEERGEDFYREAMKLQLEGIMAKTADSAYRGGRSANWLKIRVDRTDDFVVVGFTEPQGSRAGFGALHVADYVGKQLTYSGRVGTGFTARETVEIARVLRPLERRTPPCVGPIPKDADTTWVEPTQVCEVRFKEWTEDGLLRQPVFLRYRDDKNPEECVRKGGKREEGRGKGKTRDAELPEPGLASKQTLPPSLATPPAVVSFSNLDKVFWPEDGYTKGDLIEYHRTISPWLLPYLKDRPLVMTRFPDGIEGKSFFQKDAPGFAPDWIRREPLWSEDTQREIDYFVCDSLEALLYVINLGTIPIHVWASRVGSLERPDWCVLDLDPKEAPFANVITVARAIRELCDEIELPSFVKTSGSSGLHVLLPLARQCTYEQSRSLGQLLAQAVIAEHGELATIVRSPAKREGKVYIDYVQNGYGRLLVVPFSARPLPGAPVSIPLRWTEVKAGLAIGKFTIRTAPARMRKLKADPVAGVLAAEPDLPAVLERLMRRFAGAGTRPKTRAAS
ncbi:MAG: DNA ligase D, partial [Gemmatimonadetes bacterium]|nr:DNA ligase D [Gemmatimonadota bacterium]